MTNPPEPWTPHPSGRESSGALEDDGVRGRMGLAFGLGAVVGAVAAALLSQEADEQRTRVIKPLRFIRPRKNEPEAPTRLSEVAREEAADLIRGLFREVGGTLTHWILDYASRPLDDLEADDEVGRDEGVPRPQGSSSGSSELPETGPK